MSKGLEALETLFNDLENASIDLARADLEEYKIIEKELKDYEETKKELEQVMEDYQDLGNSCYKKLKALEIIEEKKVNVSALLELDNLKQYNDYCDMVGGCKRLTKEEYGLLKEILL